MRGSPTLAVGKSGQVSSRIVNVASIAGVEGEVYSAGYCTAKHGLIGLTRALAVEFTKEKLRVNAVCPGQHANRAVDGVPGAPRCGLPRRQRQGRGLTVSDADSD